MARDEWSERGLVERFCAAVRGHTGAVSAAVAFVASPDDESLPPARRDLVAAAVRLGCITAGTALKAGPSAGRAARRRALADEGLSLVLAVADARETGALFLGLVASPRAVSPPEAAFLSELFAMLREGRDRIRRARAALRRDRLAAVGSIASIVSHGARNRLATLRGALELLQAGFDRDLTPEYREMLLREFDEFIGDFNLGIDMIRSDVGPIQEASAREIVEDAAKLFGPRAARAGVDLSVSLGHGKDRISADRRLLRLALLNLLRNAEEALAGATSPRVALRTMNEGEWLHVEVADNGPGVPAAIHDLLFQENASGRAEGAGLGLSLCRDAMALMGGSVAYLTPRGRPGAVFRLSVPLARG